MDNYQNFQPNNEEEKQWIELYNSISTETSKKIRELSEEKRLPYLRASDPTDLSLMNLYLQAMKKEDYETCVVAKALLLERGFQFQKPLSTGIITRGL
jgi:hypothetical protein